jgi:anti-sigma regulatory factor (Ser/Thr protein kinase)
VLADQLSLDLPMSEDAPALARRAIAGLGLGEPVGESATLLASELVSNAVRHSGAGVAEPIRLRATVGTGSLRICVTDAGGGFVPEAERREPGVGGGFGLFLVERLAGTWGVKIDTRTTVWLELSLSRA